MATRINLIWCEGGSHVVSQNLAKHYETEAGEFDMCDAHAGMNEARYV